MGSSSQEVDTFLAGLPDEKRLPLQHLREIVAATASEAEERIGYGIPAFYYKKRPLVSYSAAKNHLSFFVQSPAVMEAHQDLLMGYETSKGTVRFTPDHPLPDDTVQTLVRARMEETDARR